MLPWSTLREKSYPNSSGRTGGGQCEVGLSRRFASWIDSCQTQEGSLCEQFLSLWQEGAVRECLRTFELLAAALEDVPEHVQESTFINNLKPDIRVEVRMMNPEGLREIMRFAQRVEERNLWNRSNKMGLIGPKSGVGLALPVYPYRQAREGFGPMTRSHLFF